MMKNRYRFNLFINVPVTVQGTVRNAYSNNISLSGINILIDHPLDVGDTVLLDMDLSVKDPVNEMDMDGSRDDSDGKMLIKATVVWVRPQNDDDESWTAGLRYVDLTESQSEHIQEKLLDLIKHHV